MVGRGQEPQVERREPQVSWRGVASVRLRLELGTGGCKAGRAGDGSLGRQGVCAQGTPSSACSATSLPFSFLPGITWTSPNGSCFL